MPEDTNYRGHGQKTRAWVMDGHILANLGNIPQSIRANSGPSRFQNAPRFKRSITWKHMMVRPAR